jgi:1-acyl-sn-glycerol-3-phosphate acyltransferase
MPKYRYPRRRVIRYLMHKLSIPVFGAVANVQLIGKENIPNQGPLLVVGNHFSFVDPVAFVRLARWPMDFIGAAFPPFAPGWTKLLVNLWGIHKLYRGTGSTEALRAAESILKQDGVIGIYPEGGSWATVLRPARPGTAYLAARTGAMLLPVGLYGMNGVFPLRFRNRATATINIGKPFGPFKMTGRGRERREKLDEIGHTIMRKIAALLPDEIRGSYSDDPARRAAAKEFEAYPWAETVEGDVNGGGLVD